MAPPVASSLRGGCYRGSVPQASLPELHTSFAEGEAGYRMLANALPHIIWTCDARGRLEWVNDRWTELTGLTQEESLRDQGALLAVHPDDRDVLQQRFGHALSAAVPCEIEYRIRNKEGFYGAGRGFGANPGLIFIRPSHFAKSGSIWTASIWTVTASRKPKARRRSVSRLRDTLARAGARF
ncbi:MAG TPA: PAS domain-containing protein [Polyangiaceae bacterium]|nr:PAS domain-containing protein [Polyangiaceae bacterium]